MDPHKPVLSRSALSCERKGDRVSIIAHEEIPTGMEGMISPSFSPFGQVSFTRARFPPKPMGIGFFPFGGRAAVTGKFGKANGFLGGKAACRRRAERCERQRSHLEPISLPVPACDTHKAPQPPAPL